MSNSTIQTTTIENKISTTLFNKTKKSKFTDLIICNKDIYNMIANLKIGRDVGSDHLPIIANIKKLQQR